MRCLAVPLLDLHRVRIGSQVLPVRGSHAFLLDAPGLGRYLAGTLQEWGCSVPFSRVPQPLRGAVKQLDSVSYLALVGKRYRPILGHRIQGELVRLFHARIYGLFHILPVVTESHARRAR